MRAQGLPATWSTIFVFNQRRKSTLSTVCANSFDQFCRDANPIMTPSNHLFVSKPDGSITSAISLDGQEVIPLAGVSDKVTVLCNENGQWVHYRSDEHGFNNSNDVWHSPYPDIAALGGIPQYRALGGASECLESFSVFLLNWSL